jgi:hypothetical protein
VDEVKQDGRTNVRPWFGVLHFVAEIFFLCLPALINGGPLVYPDTRSYFLGGRTAIEKVASLFTHNPGGNQSVEATVQKARGVRSAFYALFAYIPAELISLWLVVILQAIIVATVLRFLFRLVVPDRQRWQATMFIAALSLLTTVSWATCNIMPDIFTSIMAICIAITIVYRYDLTPRIRFFVACGIAGSMVMHMANLPIAVGLLIIDCLMMGRHAWDQRNRYRPVLGAIIGGVAAMLVVGVVGFHQWTIAPQAPPFLLARSLQDGPGRLYLLEHCPQIGLDMCKHLDKLDLRISKFIWDDDGVYSVVSPDEEAQLRAEDKRIYIAAAIEHPWLQAEAMARNAFLQLVTFSLHEYYIPSWAEYTSSDMKLHIPDQAPWQTDLSIIEYLVVIGSLGYICLKWRELPRSLTHLSIMVIGTVLLEALAGAISEPVPRYEARVIWLVPMTALLIWSRSRGAGHVERA